MPVFWVALLLGVISVLLMNPTVANPNARAINGDLLFSVFGIAEIIRFFWSDSALSRKWAFVYGRGRNAFICQLPIVLVYS